MTESKTTFISFDDVPSVIADHARERREQYSVSPKQDIDPLTAMQLAVFTILGGMTMYSLDLNSLLTGGDSNPREFTFKSVAFDSHEFETDAVYPNVTVNSEAPIQYGDGAEHGLSTHLDEEDTVDKFADGTQLRHLTDALGVLEVRTAFANREDRAGAHAGIVRHFAAEPADFRPGRRVVVPIYYDQIVRLELLTVDLPGRPRDAIAEQWDLTLRLRATTPVVMLVRTQPDLRLRRFIDSYVTEPPEC